MSLTPLLSESPATVPRGRVDYARPPPDTSPHQITTGATTTAPHHVKLLRIMEGPHPGMVPRALRGTNPHVRLSTVHQGPLIEPVGAALHLGIALRGMDPSMSVTMSMSGIMSLLPMSKASLMATHIHMGTHIHTHVHRGLPATGPLCLLTHIPAGCPMATAHHHLLLIAGDLQEHHPTLTIAQPMPEALARACMNLIARRMRMTGASSHCGQGIRVIEEMNSNYQCPGFGNGDF